MKAIRFVILVGVVFWLVFAVQTASATVLTFDVQESNVYVGNNKNIPDSYGSDVTAANTPDGDYLEGNGWTPAITITYLPKAGVDPGTGDGNSDTGGGSNIWPAQAKRRPATCVNSHQSRLISHCSCRLRHL